MDDRLLALLERSNLFSQAMHGFIVKVKVNPPEKFRFWLPNCFFFENKPKGDEQVPNFEHVLKSFIRRYLKSWIKFIEPDPKKPFNSEDFGFSMADFFSNFDGEKYYNQVVSGKETVAIPILPNNSQLLVRRLGDILAFTVLRYSSKDEEHITGIRATEALCRTSDPFNNQGVYELVHDIQVSLTIPKTRTENGGTERGVDFAEIKNILKISLPNVQWDFSPSMLVESYQGINDDGVVVGKYFDLPIHAYLIHNGAEGKNDITHENFHFQSRARIWRQGNTEKLSESKYRFKEGENLFLALSLKCSLPYSTWGKVDTSIEAHHEQFVLARAGAIFSTQLCSMMLNNYQAHLIKQGN